jgi:protein-S-isoprenylcysteine O-methyltransferase
MIGYFYVTYRFFEDRIYDEERYLIEFFGRRYINYQSEVPSGIPFIHGYQLPANVHLD